jgi:hypothetical protein
MSHCCQTLVCSSASALLGSTASCCRRRRKILPPPPPKKTTIFGMPEAALTAGRAREEEGDFFILSVRFLLCIYASFLFLVYFL